jgi:hypothetical protein
MSNTKPVSLVKGLLVGASVALAPGNGPAADEPTLPRRPAIAAPAADAERYLLLTDSRLIAGKISHDDTHYTVVQKIGPILFPKHQVERSFDTIQQAYQYQLQRVPEDDPSEQLRLARWCLNHQLSAEAKTQLARVLEISPQHGPAKAMLDKITQSELSRIERGRDKVDAAVRQTAAEDVAEDRPGALDSAVLRGAGRRMGIPGLPVIFDLPPAAAIQRADQFRQYVHPILQAYCAKCHSGEYAGQFQLIPASTARQRTPDVLRANLDATLRLVDPDNPAKSDLLSSTLRAHGLGGRRRPIFSGSNDRAYQILARWVNSVRPTAGPTAAGSEGRQTGAETGETFAADRNRAGLGPLEPVAQAIRTGDPRRLPSPTNSAGHISPHWPYRDAQVRETAPDDQVQGDAAEFPVPFMFGGKPPKARSSVPARDAGGPSGSPSKADAPPGTTEVSRGQPADDQADARAPVPAGQGAVKAGAGSSTGGPAPKKKPVKLNPAILKKLLEKNTGRPTGE